MRTADKAQRASIDVATPRRGGRRAWSWFGQYCIWFDPCSGITPGAPRTALDAKQATYGKGKRWMSKDKKGSSRNLRPPPYGGKRSGGTTPSTPNSNRVGGGCWTVFLTESLVKRPPTPRVLESDLGIIILIIGSGGDSNTPGVGGCWTDRAQHCKPILSQVGPPPFSSGLAPFVAPP